MGSGFLTSTMLLLFALASCLSATTSASASFDASAASAASTDSAAAASATSAASAASSAASNASAPRSFSFAPGSVSGNILVDDFLANIASKLDEKYEPIDLPDAGFNFEKKIIFVNVKGEARLTEGYLAGFSTLHRNGDAEWIASPGTRILKAPLGASNMMGHYRGRAKFMNIGPVFDVDITMTQLSVEMYLMQKDDDDTAFLASIKMIRIGEIKHKVTGLGPLDWILTPFNQFLVNILRNFIWGYLEDKVKVWLGEQIRLEKIQLPELGKIRYSN